MLSTQEPQLEELLELLVEVFLSTDEEEYPIRINGIFSASDKQYSRIINTKEECNGRIKQLAQLLDIDYVTAQIGCVELTYNIN